MDGAVLPSTLMVKAGRWWFKRRSVSPLPFLVVMFFLPPDFYWEGIGFLIPLAIAFLAEGLRLWAVGYAGSATRTRGDKVADFVHSGPYCFVRNPLYVANITLYTSCTVLFGFTYLSILFFVYSCIQYHLIVAFEESTLLGTFGTVYANYTRNVPRWFPSLMPLIPSTSHAFELRRAVRSERSTLIAIATIGLAYFIKARS